MEPKKPVFSSLDSTSFVDVVTLAEILDDSMEAGYQFYLTDEELVLFCLKRKICGLGKDFEMIPVIDIYKCNPEDLLAPTILQNDDGKNRDWFFFSPVAKNHPNKEWFHRTSEQGYWETTGEDHVLTWDSLAIGVKKTFVYYERKTGQTSWFMHQYTLHEDELKRCEKVQDLYILCKVFKKKGATALVVKEGSENGDTTMDIDVKTSGDIQDLMDVDDFHRKLNSILFGPIRAPAPAPHPIPELHVDAYFMIPQINPGHPQNAEGEVSPVPVPELEPLPMPMSMLVPVPTPEPPRNALPLPDGNGNGGQPPAAPQQENHPPTDIHNEEIQAHQLDMSEISEVDDDFVDPLPEFPNEEDPLQNVELVEDSGVLLIDPYAIPGMVYIGHGHSDDDADADADDDDDDDDDEDEDDDDDDDVAIVDEGDDEVEFEEGEIVLYLEPDVISSISYEIPLSDTESETSVLQPNREFEVQTYGSGGENNIPNPAEENNDVVEEQNNDSAPTDEGDSEATSSSSHHVD